MGSIEKMRSQVEVESWNKGSVGRKQEKNRTPRARLHRKKISHRTHKGIVTSQISLHMGEKKRTHGDPCTLPWGHAQAHRTDKTNFEAGPCNSVPSATPPGSSRRRFP